MDVRIWSSQHDYIPLQIVIVVEAVNDAPIVDVWDFVSEVTDEVVLVLEDTETILPLLTVADVDASDNLTGLVTVNITATYGTVRLPRCRGLHFVDGNNVCNSYSSSLIFEGGVEQVNAAIEQLHYVSAADWTSDTNDAVQEVQRITASFSEFVTIFTVTTQCLNCVIDSGNFSLEVIVGNITANTHPISWNASAEAEDANSTTLSVQEALQEVPMLANATIAVQRNDHGLSLIHI